MTSYSINLQRQFAGCWSWFALRFYVVCKLKLLVFIKRIGVEKVLSNDLLIEGWTRLPINQLAVSDFFFGKYAYFFLESYWQRMLRFHWLKANATILSTSFLTHFHPFNSAELEVATKIYKKPTAIIEERRKAHALWPLGHVNVTKVIFRDCD